MGGSSSSGSARSTRGSSVTITAFRGVGPYGTPADPGDLGIGRYYSTSRGVASSYGTVSETSLTLKNPKRVDGTEATRLVEKYGTLKGTLEQRKAAATKMTADFKKRGYDGLIISGWDSPPGEFTIVEFPK